MNAPNTIVIPDDDIEEPLAPEGWTVDSEERAAWAVDVLLSHEERCERIKRQHVSTLGRAEKELERAKAFFLPMLRAWAEQNPPRKGRTIHLSTGSMSFRKKNGGVFVEDEKACLEWAEQNLPEAIRREVTRKLDVERAKRAGEQVLSTATAEAFMAGVPASEVVVAAAEKLPPGMVRRDDEDTFEIKAPGTKGVK